MKRIYLLLSIFAGLINACAQPATRPEKPTATDVKVGGPCEDCEAIYECPVPFDQLNHLDTLPDFPDHGPKLHVSGVMYRKDGRTPAAGIVMYFYHTDQTGVYPKKGTEQGIDRKHGYLRGWLRTDEKGRYSFFTLRPASYPDSRNPAHIHAIIKEPGMSEYWIDDFLFADDPLLPKEKNQRQPRGGNGVLQPVAKDGIAYATRDIILGLNIENYPH